MATQPTVTLSTGHAMPQLGFGVFKIPDAETQAAVTDALEVGYRSIDTAAMYQNERAVGQAVKAAGLPRDELFITTKLNIPNQGYDSALRAFDASLALLGLDHVDLYLIHWPQPRLDRYVESWRALQQIHADGRAASIGVSNFEVDHLQRLADETGVTPSVNQIELHPYLVQTELRAFHAEHGIATEAWSPLARGGTLLSDPTIVSLAEKYGKTPAQIVIGWHLALGNVVIPKSVTPARIAENFDVFDVELDADDIASISELDRDFRTGPNPNTFN